MPRWFRLEPADDDFFRTAPHVFRYRIETTVPAERVWACLVSDESLSAWGPRVQQVRWESERPFGVGTRRTVTLQARSVTVREQFHRWDEGEHYGFHVVEANRPGLRRLAEDYVVSTTPQGAVLDWTVALEAQPAARLAFRALAPVVKASFGAMARDGQRYFARHR
jgi:hypothetical protein